MEIVAIAASSAGVTITVAIAMFIMGRRAADAERRAGEQGIRATASEGKLLAATVASDAWQKRATEAEAKNAKLVQNTVDAIDRIAATGADARVQAGWARLPGGPATATASGELHVPGEPATPGPDDLERP